MAFPRTQRLGYDDLTRRVFQEVEAEPPDFILAESFSGPLAIKFLEHHRGKVRGLILCASFVAPPVSGILRSLRHGVFGWTVRGGFSVPAIRWLLAGGDRGLASRVRTTLRTVDPKVIALRLRQVLATDVSREFTSLEIPVLNLVASRDRLVRRVLADSLPAAHSLLETVVIEAPHLMLQSAPDASARAITRFLTKHLSGG